MVGVRLFLRVYFTRTFDTSSITCRPASNPLYTQLLSELISYTCPVMPKGGGGHA